VAAVMGVALVRYSTLTQNKQMPEAVGFFRCANSLHIDRMIYVYARVMCGLRECVAKDRHIYRHLGRMPKLTRQQRKETIARKANVNAVSEIARGHNVQNRTVSRLAQ
jgi:hypothetical protein